MALKTINSFPLTPEWRYGGSTGKLRLYYTESFIDNESRSVVGAAVGSSGFYREVDITIASLVATVAGFILVTTEDSDHPNAKVIGVLYDSSGTRRDTLFEWSVPSNSTLASPSTFAAMETYNHRNTIINPPEFYLTQDQILAFLNARLAALGIAPATNLALGIVKLSAVAADPANPVVWEQGDPNARDAQKLKGVNLDATMGAPADTNVPVFDALSNTWKPGVGAQGAAGGDLSGAYPNPSVVDDSHLHSPLTIVSVTGVPGLLADGQTALAHKASHESGGSDALKLDDLAAPDDNTDLNASTSAHGLLKKLSNDATEFLNGQGNFAVPAGTGYSVAEDEGTPVTVRSTMNFVGAGVSVADSGGKTVVTIAGGGSGGLDITTIWAFTY